MGTTCDGGGPEQGSTALQSAAVSDVSTPCDQWSGRHGGCEPARSEAASGLLREVQVDVDGATGSRAPERNDGLNGPRRSAFLTAFRKSGYAAAFRRFFMTR